MVRSIRWVVVMLAAMASPGVWAAWSCASPALKSASGVIGNLHSYKLAGSCQQAGSKTESGWGSSTTTNYAYSYSYVGSARWDRASGVASEKLQFTGDGSGARYAEATCSQDPFLKDPPGGAATCNAVKVQIEMKSGTIYEFLQKAEFWSGHKLSLAEAQALSALAASAPAGSGEKPPEKPPAPKVPVVSADSMPEPAVSGGAAPARVPMTGTVASGSPPQDVAGRAAVIEQMEHAGREAGREVGQSRPADAGARTPNASSAGARAPNAPSAGASTSSASSAGARATSPAASAGARAPNASSAGAARTANPSAQPVQIEVEGEALVRAGAFQVAGGQVRVQPMASFGGGWSGGEQLFWSGGAVGAVLDLLVDVPAASKYALEIYMTRAPDYGQVRFEIDGKTRDVPLDGMAAQVFPTGPQQLGTFALQPGTRRISLMIIGKHPQATNYFVGIDKLRLYPAGPID